MAFHDNDGARVGRIAEFLAREMGMSVVKGFMLIVTDGAGYWDCLSNAADMGTVKLAIDAAWHVASESFTGDAGACMAFPGKETAGIIGMPLHVTNTGGNMREFREKLSELVGEPIEHYMVIACTPQPPGGFSVMFLRSSTNADGMRWLADAAITAQSMPADTIPDTPEGLMP